MVLFMSIWSSASVHLGSDQGLLWSLPLSSWGHVGASSRVYIVSQELKVLESHNECYLWDIRMDQFGLQFLTHKTHLHDETWHESLPCSITHVSPRGGILGTLDDPLVFFCCPCHEAHISICLLRENMFTIALNLQPYHSFSSFIIQNLWFSTTRSLLPSARLLLHNTQT